jgi:hypothetical protein
MVLRYIGGVPVNVPPYTKAEWLDTCDRMNGTGKYAGRPMVIAHSGPRSAGSAGGATSPQTAAASPAAAAPAGPPQGRAPRRKRS